MRKLLGLFVLAAIAAFASVAMAAQPLVLAYPPANHTTTADRIFLIGTASPEGEVLVNGVPIQQRSPQGHFAPSFPLQVGVNRFTISHDNREIDIQVTRELNRQEIPEGIAFAKDSLTPAVDIARRPGELICFSAIAPPQATVSVKLADRTIPLTPGSQADLPDNKAVLVGGNNPSQVAIGHYQGCAKAETPGPLGIPVFQLTMQGQTIVQAGTGKITILSPTDFEVAEVTVEAGVTRTGPSSDYSRLTPLPKGTRVEIVGRDGEWLKLDYGVWIKSSEVRILKDAVPPRSIVRSITSRQVGDWTEIRFPLQIPIPVSVQQGESKFTLTLYNTTAQTDIIRLDDNPLISRLDWQQVAPERVEYTFNLKSPQQWGYKLKYEGTTLVLSLKNPPLTKGQMEREKPLSGLKILLDPGHGGPDDLGGVGPTGYREKTVTLTISKLVRSELVNLGATVVMTRVEDVDLDLPPRIAKITQEEPAIALSLHYNALPDNGDAINTKGIGAFWFHPQAHSLAVFLHNYLVEKLDRPSYGVFWNNLAMTRPAVTPSVLMELGFMINPFEFEWIINPQEQQKLATAIAQGIVEWFSTHS